MISVFLENCLCLDFLMIFGFLYTKRQFLLHGCGGGDWRISKDYFVDFSFVQKAEYLVIPKM